MEYETRLEDAKSHAKKASIGFSLGMLSIYGGLFGIGISPGAGAIALGAGTAGIFYSTDQGFKTLECLVR